jgi:hypothetical protein
MEYLPESCPRAERSARPSAKIGPVFSEWQRTRGNYWTIIMP